MISRLVAIELCETTCLSALFFKKRCQMGSIPTRHLRVGRKYCITASVGGIS